MNERHETSWVVRHEDINSCFGFLFCFVGTSQITNQGNLMTTSKPSKFSYISQLSRTLQLILQHSLLKEPIVISEYPAMKHTW